MAAPAPAWLDGDVLVPAERLFLLARAHLPAGASWASASAAARHAVRYLSVHTGIPALLVAAVLVAVGYRLLKRTLRFGLEVAAIAAALGLMTAAGWIQW